MANDEGRRVGRSASSDAKSGSVAAHRLLALCAWRRQRISRLRRPRHAPTSYGPGGPRGAIGHPRTEDRHAAEVTRPDSGEPLSWWYVSLVCIGIALDHSSGFHQAIDRITELEKTGIDVGAVAEAYSFDAANQLGYLTAKTSTAELDGVLSVFPIDAPHASVAGNDRRRFEFRIRWPSPSRAQHVQTAGDGRVSRRRVRCTAPGRTPRCRGNLSADVTLRSGCNTPVNIIRSHLSVNRVTGLSKPLHLINHPVHERVPAAIVELRTKKLSLLPRSPRTGNRSFSTPRRPSQSGVRS
uniref:B229_F3_111 n=1 Tax=Mycobacterium leprae TaxID=1769 RepID=Q49879_MYCLR|nr:B229_F3_111 [Mycobacterium leprae]